MEVSNAASELNEGILARIESIGGGYVWDAEVFAVILMEIQPTDSDIADLSKLVGVQQIALNATHLSFPAILSVAQTAGLQSLVLSNSSLSQAQLLDIQALVPEVVLESNEG